MGLYGYAMWLVGTLGVLANIGLPSAITKYISEFVGRGEEATAARIAKRLLWVQFLVAVSLSALTACFALLNTPYRGSILLAAVMLLAQASQQSLSAVLVGIQRFDQVALAGLYTSIGQILAVGLAAFLHASVIGMLWATLAGLWIGVGFSYRYAYRFCSLLPSASPPERTLPRDLFRRIMKFSMTVSFVLLLDTIVWQRSEILFLKWYSALEQIAFYTLAYSIVSKLSEVSTTISGTLLPLYSESYGRTGFQEVGKIFESGMKYIQMIMVPTCLLGVAAAKQVVHLLYGTRYAPVVLPLQVMLISLAITSLGSVNSSLLLGAEKQSFIAKYGTFIAVVNITLDFILIPHFGALGASFANSAAQIAGVLGGNFYVARLIGARFPWRATFLIYACALVAVAPLTFLNNWIKASFWVLLVCAIGGGLLYLAGLVAIRQLGRAEFDILRKALSSKWHQADQVPMPKTSTTQAGCV